MMQDSNLNTLCLKLLDTSLPNGLMIATPPPDFHILYANSKLLSMFGITEVEAINTLIAQGTFAMPQLDMEKISREAAAENARTFLMVRNDGTYCWLSEVISLAELRDGEKVIAVSYTDISAYKDTEQRLQQVNAEISTIYNNIPGGAFQCRYNQDWDIIFANDGLFQFLGYTREEFAAMGNKMSAVIYEDDKAPMLPIIQNQLAHGNTVENINRLVCKDGSVKWISIHGTLSSDFSGNPCFYCVFVDITAQKKAEKRLLESEERYRVAIDGAGVNVWEYDIIHKRIIQSEGSIKKHGFEKIIENVPQIFIETNYVADEYQDEFLAMYKKIDDGQTPVIGDFWVYDVHRNRYWCERVYYSVVCDDAGRPIKAYGASQDVTQFKISEKKYQEELQYRNKMSDSVIAACCVNLTQGYVEELRVGSGESIAKQHRDAIDYEDRVRLFAYDLTLTQEQRHALSRQGLLERYGRGEESYETEFTAQITQGDFIWVRCRVNILKMPNSGELVAFFYNEDVTIEKTLTGIMESVVETDYDFVGRIDINNEKYTAFSRATPQKLSHMRVDYNSELKKYMACSADAKLAKKVCHDLSIKNIVAKLETASVFTYETKEKDDTGVPRSKLYRYFYLNKEAGFILATRTDIDDIVKKEQAKQDVLEKAINAKMEFLSRMSHDMRTPMNAIIGLSSLALDTNDQFEVNDYLKKINLSGKYLLGLINDTLDMSRIDSGNLTLTPEPYLGKEFCETLYNMLEPKAKSKDITFIVDPAFNTAPTLMVDKLRFTQIFVNLANNAIKFTPKGGRVAIMLDYFKDHGDVQSFSISVVDNGMGMSKAFQTRMYERFEQEKRAQMDDEVGTGLGLAIVRRLVDAIGGNITCDSAPGKGTTFHITFSARFKQQEETAIVSQQPEDLSILAGKCILLAEDHPLNVQVAIKLLEKYHVNVELAQNGNIALDMFAHSAIHHFDGILMDIRMPEMDGLKTTRAIRSLNRVDATTVPIIAMTANAYDDDVQKSKEAGMNGHIAKPIVPELLYKTIASFMKNEKV